ncbi:MAG: hypothetical protein ACYSYL_09480 [Planctomycetota bacterium]
MNIRLTFLVVIGLIVLAVVGIWHFSSKPETVTPIPSSGGALIDITPQDNGAYFLQTDSRWANDPLGGSGESFSSVGCTICSIAMAASCLGYEITPKVLNSRLTQLRYRPGTPGWEHSCCEVFSPWWYSPLGFSSRQKRK